MRKPWITTFDSPLLSAASTTSPGSGTTAWPYEGMLPKGSIQSFAPNEKKPRVATVYGCICNMLATILGSGLLALPYAMAGCGVCIGALVFLLIMVLSTVSYLNLSQAVGAFSNGCNFMKLAKVSLPKQFYWIVDFCVCINGSGCGVGYLIVMSTLMPKVIKYFSPNVDQWVLNRRLWVAVFAGIAFPLLIPKNLDALKFTSLLVVIFVLYSLVVMIYYFMNPPPSLQLTPVVTFDFPSDVVQFLKVFAIIVNAFSCSQNVPSVVNSLVNPTPTRLKFIISTSTGICLVVYLVAGYIGYVTFGEHVDSNILRSYPHELLLINIARLSITLALTGSYAVQLHPARNSLSVLLNGVSAEELRPRQYYPMTIGIWGATAGVALITDNLGTVSTFIGALAAVPLTFIYPNLFWIKVSKRLGPSQTVWHAWLILILGFIFIPLSLSTEIYQLYTGVE